MWGTIRLSRSLILLLVDLLGADDANCRKSAKKANCYLNLNEMRAIQTYSKKKTAIRRTRSWRPLPKPGRAFHHKTFRGIIRYTSKEKAAAKLKLFAAC